MSDYVLDASAFLAWLLPDEENPLLDALRRKNEPAFFHVPELWVYEIINGLQISRIRGRLTNDLLRQALEAIRGPDIKRYPVNDDAALIENSALYGLSVYDASYLTLAKTMNMPLLTFDKRLAEAAKKAGLPQIERYS